MTEPRDENNNCPVTVNVELSSLTDHNFLFGVKIR